MSPKPKKPEVTKMEKLLKKPDLTIAQAAQVLDLSRPTVYKLIDAGDIKITRRKTLTFGFFVSTESVVRYARDVQLRQLPYKRN